ncbi:MAG: 2-C-methyl-D-erythritol 4-phosphate cytidylyltransferase [Betaproteobacteria bacterium HGW-Betaproteobacteria-22]|nr:MAG: 2-C-methyl-D-erythritol 4-phosphate cytidylyltransferase [Betaproteobacteria bacterium HGW-Betaproteobacteria-22]
MQRFHVIIPAAGVGSRMASAMPKQYLPLCGKPTISHSIHTFFTHPRIASIYLALSPEDYFWRELQLNSHSRLKLHYTGGDSRADTVINTLRAIESEVDDQDWILVHDAARPGLTHDLLSHLLDTLEHDAVGGLLALPLADTLKVSNSDMRVINTIPREALWQAQTPQMFRYALLRDALHSFNGTPTDEAQTIEALGLQPKLVMGSLRNMKITYPQDMALMELFMQKDSV